MFDSNTPTTCSSGRVKSSFCWPHGILKFIVKPPIFIGLTNWYFQYKPISFSVQVQGKKLHKKTSGISRRFKI
jgi:hypothetical protein